MVDQRGEVVGHPSDERGDLWQGTSSEAGPQGEIRQVNGDHHQRSTELVTHVYPSSAYVSWSITYVRRQHS